MDVKILEGKLRDDIREFYKEIGNSATPTISMKQWVIFGRKTQILLTLSQKVFKKNGPQM